MQLDRFLRHLEEGHHTAAGENLGNELPRNRLWFLAKVRSRVALMQKSSYKTYDDYSLGYQDAITDILSAYENAVRDNINQMLSDITVVTDEERK